MQERDRFACLNEIRARAATFLTQARETDDAWFAEQLSRLAKDYSEYADTLELESAHNIRSQTICGSPNVPQRFL
jgi:hypothetical protein